MENFDTLYHMVLVGRMYETISRDLIITAFIVGSLSGVVALVMEKITKPILYIWGFVSLCIIGSIITAGIRASYPTIDDVKIIVAYKAGEKILTSDEFKAAYDKLLQINEK